MAKQRNFSELIAISLFLEAGVEAILEYTSLHGEMGRCRRGKKS
jgi:hypothetical protein